MKNNPKNKNQKKTYTLEEYKEKFQPSTTENLSIFQQSPQEIGMKLANEAINNLKQTLVELSKGDT